MDKPSDHDISVIRQYVGFLLQAKLPKLRTDVIEMVS